MKIAIANDHGGYEAKRKISEMLREMGHEVEDFGSAGTASVDYPDYGIPAAQSVVDGKNERGILICSNGIGMSMLANRHPEIRGALVYSRETAAATRRHHDSNILCLGGKEFPHEDLQEFVRIWLRTEFDGGRHERRIKKFGKYECIDFTD